MEKHNKYTGERLVSSEKILNPMRVENLARFKFFLSKFQRGRILDLGCGNGEGTYFLSQNEGMMSIGIDISSEVLRIAHQEYSLIPFFQMDVCSLAFNNHTFDGVVSVEVIEHVLNPMAYLMESYRVLKPGGVFMLTTPNRLRTRPPTGTGSSWPAHVREYTPNELLEMLSRLYSSIDLWGQSVPIYENNIIRKSIYFFAPFIKPLLPRFIRINFLPTLQYRIKPEIGYDDIFFSKEEVEESPTLVVVCKKEK